MTRTMWDDEAERAMRDAEEKKGEPLENKMTKVSPSMLQKTQELVDQLADAPVDDPAARMDLLARQREIYLSSRMERGWKMEEMQARLVDMLMRRMPDMPERMQLQTLQVLHKVNSDDELSLLLGHSNAKGGINILTQNILGGNKSMRVETVSGARVGFEGEITTTMKDLDILSDALKTVGNQLLEDKTAQKMAMDADEVVDAEVVEETEDVDS